jgi:1,4-alpha-glucan branching enzyme
MMNTMSRSAADIILVLHAHLPYVRIPQLRFPLQELWLFQSLVESYIPLLIMLEDLVDSDFTITFSLSPTLLSMIADEYFQEKCRDYMITVADRLGETSAKRSAPFAAAASFMHSQVERVIHYYDQVNGDLIGRFRKLSERGVINLITTCATHALLPAFRFNSDLIRLQVMVGLQEFEHHFGFTPRGFWLPEMGYFSGLDRILSDLGIEYTFIDTAGVYRSGEIPRRGAFSHLVSTTGLFFFARDRILSRILWSSKIGYPGDYRYREFHHTAMPVRDDDTMKGKVEIPIGLKLYRITGEDRAKEWYCPDGAVNAVVEHSRNFVEQLFQRGQLVQDIIQQVPLFTLPFDAELFGHWWYEGPAFLSEVIRKISCSDALQLVSPEAVLKRGSVEQVQPSESSWGSGDLFSTWLKSECLWLYPRIMELFAEVRPLLHKKTHEDAVVQAVKELLLAQSSDWTFLISTRNSEDYARHRLDEHLDAAERIIQSLKSGALEQDFLSERMKCYPLFTDLREVLRR